MTNQIESLKHDFNNKISLKDTLRQIYEDNKHKDEKTKNIRADDQIKHIHNQLDSLMPTVEQLKEYAKKYTDFRIFGIEQETTYRKINKNDDEHDVYKGSVKQVYYFNKHRKTDLNTSYGLYKIVSLGTDINLMEREIPVNYIINYLIEKTKEMGFTPEIRDSNIKIRW